MVSMLNKVVEISVPVAYVLRVRFQDGASGQHDCSMLASESGPIVEPFRDPGFFARVTLERGAPTWPNGYDMCPDWLRMEMEKAGELIRAAAE